MTPPQHWVILLVFFFAGPVESIVFTVIGSRGSLKNASTSSCAGVLDVDQRQDWHMETFKICRIPDVAG